MIEKYQNVAGQQLTNIFMRHRTWRIPKSPLIMSYNVSDARRLVKRDSVEPNVSEQNVRMSTFWRRPRSEHASDEAMHLGLYGVKRCARLETRSGYGLLKKRSITIIMKLPKIGLIRQR